MKKKISKWRLLIPFWIILLIISYFGWECNTKRDRKLFWEFYNTDINGRLVEVGIGNKNVYFYVNNSKDGFVFLPYTDEINDNHIFNYFAEPGDSVIKPAHSDTLVLIKDKRRYLYTFFKFEQ